MTQKFKMTGWKELNYNLMRLEKMTTQKATLRKALLTSGKEIAEAAAGKAPKGETGNLQASFTVSTKLNKAQTRAHRKYKSKTGVEAFIGPAGKGSRHAGLVEFGTKNMSPRPFLRPSWNAGKEKLLEVLGDEMAKAIEKAIKRQARRQAKRGN